jgi:hypothetical protein
MYVFVLPAALHGVLAGIEVLIVAGIAAFKAVR